MATPAVRVLMGLARARVTTKAAVNERAVLAALTAWFGSKDAIKATQLPDNLIKMLIDTGIDVGVAEKVGNMVLARPLTGRSRHGAPAPYQNMSAIRRVASEEPGLRAAYVLSAARRLTDAVENDTYTPALSNEERFLAMHVAAGRNRRRAARAVDDVSGGDEKRVLVWRTRHDSRVEAACRVLEGRLFTADNPPGGAYPGAKHLRCRCRAETWGSPGPYLQWGAD